MNSVRIIVFAKAPIPGFAKTRLIPALGDHGAAKLAVKMLRHTITQALEAQCGQVELCVSPSLNHPIWQTLDLPASIILTEQGSGDLGQRLSTVTQRALLQASGVLLIGTDCPGLSAHRLQCAALALEDNDVCCVPVSDGGYALLGLKHFHPSVFEEIPWSTEGVYASTEQSVRVLGWQFKRLEMLHDIDEPEDLQWLPSDWEEAKLAAL